MTKYLIISLLIAFVSACMPPKKEAQQEVVQQKYPVDTIAEKGASLFKQHCSSCHLVDRKLVGPPLKGISQKYDKKWLYAYIRDNQKLIKAGDPKAIAIYEEYGKAAMNNFTFLADEDIDAILRYIDNMPK